MYYHVFPQLISNHIDVLSLPPFFISVTPGPQGRPLEASIVVAEREGDRDGFAYGGMYANYK